jgi:hypothetical protein
MTGEEYWAALVQRNPEAFTGVPKQLLIVAYDTGHLNGYTEGLIQGVEQTIRVQEAIYGVQSPT